MTLHRQTPRLSITAAMRREEARPSGWARGGEGAEMRSVHVTPHTAHTPAARLGTGTLGSLRQRCGPGPRGARAKARPPPSTAPGTRAALSLRSGGAWHVDGSPGQRACGAAAGAGVRGCLILGDGGREAASGPRELSPRLRQSGAGADGTTPRGAAQPAGPRRKDPRTVHVSPLPRLGRGRQGRKPRLQLSLSVADGADGGPRPGRPGPCRAPAVGVAYSSR